jgi:hypothetical protein
VTMSDDGRETAGSPDGLRAEIVYLLERLTSAIDQEYVLKGGHVAHSPEQRRAEIVQKLLAGHPVDPADMAELDYDVHSSWHLGLIATGAGATEFVRTLRAHFGRKLLVVSVDWNAWAWLGGEKRPDAADIERPSVNCQVRPSVAVGEPGRGLDGLRLTHDQARAALGVALRNPERFARYADDRLLAAVLENNTLARSLRQKYLMPLRSQRDGGAMLRQTLRTYIDLEDNATSAAEVLKVGRRAVKSRVCVAERLIGCPLRACSAELDVALRLEELDRRTAVDISPSTQ